MPEWIVERGIGEMRAARIEKGGIVEARILVDGIVPAGTALRGTLKHHGFQQIAIADGQEYLLPQGAHGVADGGPLTIEVVRERIPGLEPWKRALAKLVHGLAGEPEGISGKELPLGSANLLDEAGWDDVVEEARTGIVRFDGGELRIVATPAMTLIDVDGVLPPEKLAMAAAGEACRAIVRLGIGGSIGIDFPTLGSKQARSSVVNEIQWAMPKPYERTALNGFGFLQIVRPRRHASLIELAQDRAGFEARDLLRRAAKNRSGATRLVAHPAIVRLFEAKSDWTVEFAKLVGGAVSLRADPSITISGGYAEQA